jgi:hypothetical protein
MALLYFAPIIANNFIFVCTRRGGVTPSAGANLLCIGGADHCDWFCYGGYAIKLLRLQASK